MVTATGGGMFPPLPPFPPIPTWAEFLEREKEIAITRRKVEALWSHCVRKLERGGLASRAEK